MEEVAEKYFEDLINRNLIMVQKRGSMGNIKTCKIHDLLRDLCLREALKERFLCIVYDDLGKNIRGKHRLGVRLNASVQDNKFSTKSDLQSMPLARTVVNQKSEMQSGIIFQLNLLRVFHVLVNPRKKYKLNDFFKLVNSRYLEFTSYALFHMSDKIISYLPWNLETLIINDWTSRSIHLPSEIWEMQHHRHIKIRSGVSFSMPDRGKNHYCVLKNLQELSQMIDLRFSDEIIGRIPNLKKLRVLYKKETTSTILNITTPKSLQKLEILKCFFPRTFSTTPNFPPMLRKLSLDKSGIPWEDMKIVGSLPKLEVLELIDQAFVGEEWNVGEGEFQRLKSLSIDRNYFKTWGVYSSSFSALESLNLISCCRLEEIPKCIIEIPSLELITLHHCKESLLISAKKQHLEAQEEGNYHLLIQVVTYLDIPSLESHDKFQVIKYRTDNQLFNSLSRWSRNLVK